MVVGKIVWSVSFHELSNDFCSWSHNCLVLSLLCFLVCVHEALTSCTLYQKRILTTVTLQCSTFAPTMCKTLCSLPRRVSRHRTQPSGIPIPNGERATYTNSANNLAVVLSPRRNMHWFKEAEGLIFLRINLPLQTVTCHYLVVLSELYRLELSECPFLALWFQGTDIQEAPTIREALCSAQKLHIYIWSSMSMFSKQLLSKFSLCCIFLILGKATDIRLMAQAIQL